MFIISITVCVVGLPCDLKKKWMLGLDQQSHVGRAVMVRGVPLNSNIGNLSNHMSKYHLLLKRGNTKKEYTQSLKERTI